MSRLQFLTADQVRIEQAPGGARLRVTVQDTLCVPDAVVKRAFPLSQPSSYISIQDRKGKELAVLRDPDQLDPSSKELLETQLDRRYFTPRITKLHSVVQEAGMWRFKVESTRGAADFYVRNWRDSAFELKPGRWQIQTVDGGRFEILNLDQLDEKSQRLMDQLL